MLKLHQSYFLRTTEPCGMFIDKLNRKIRSIANFLPCLYTMVDLIHYQTKLGGLNRMLAILEELIDELNDKDIIELLTWYPHKSTLQRYGYILEELQASKNYSIKILEHLKKSKYYPVLLSPKSGLKPKAVKNSWKVVVNIKLENDL